MHTSNSGLLVTGSFQVHLKMFPSYVCILQHINQHNPLILHYIAIVLGVGERWGVLPGTSRSFLLTGQLQKYLLLAGLGIVIDLKKKKKNLLISSWALLFTSVKFEC